MIFNYTYKNMYFNIVFFKQCLKNYVLLIYILMANIKTIDPVIDVNLEYKTIVLENGSSIQTRNYPSTNYTASGGVSQWTVAVPSNRCFTDRCFLLDCEIQVTWTGTTTAQFHAGYDALRQYPLAQCMLNPTLQIQNVGVSNRVNEIINALLWYHDTKHKSICPTYLDQFQLYSSGVGTSRNPLGIYENTFGEQCQRGAFTPSALTITSTTSAVATYRIVEPLFVAPLNDEESESLGLTNITQMNLEIPWSDLSRMVSHTDYTSQTLSSVAVVFTRAPILWLHHVIPKTPILKSVSYPHQNIISYPTTASSLAPNASVTVQCNNIQVDRVPKLMYVYACIPPASKTYNSTDTFCAITNLSIQYDNTPNILSTASQEILYEISRKNGCKMNLQQWRGLAVNPAGTGFYGTVGSVFCGRFGIDIPCIGTPNDMYPTNLQIQCTIKNVNQSDTFTPSVYVVVVYDSKLVIDVDGMARIENGINNSLPSEYAPFAPIRKYQGAGFKEVIAKIWGFIKQALPIVGPIVGPMLKGIIGMGDGGSNVAGSIGGSSVGGKQMTEGELLKILRRK